MPDDGIGSPYFLLVDLPPALGFFPNSRRISTIWDWLCLVQTHTCKLSDFIFTVRRRKSTPCSNKAVSDGAVSFHLDHLVTTRVSRMAYGMRCRGAYDPHNPEHRRRGSILLASGELKVDNVFSVILHKVSVFFAKNYFFWCKFAPGCTSIWNPRVSGIIPSLHLYSFADHLWSYTKI